MQIKNEDFRYKTQNGLKESKVSLKKEFEAKNFSVDEKKLSDIENIDMLLNNFKNKEMLKDLDKIEEALAKKVKKMKEKKVIAFRVEASEID